MTIPSDFVTGKLLQQSLLKIVNAFDTKIVDSHTFQDKAINLPPQRGKSTTVVNRCKTVVDYISMV